MYADIIVDISLESLDKTYQYRVPKTLEEKITIGTPVVIPFGNGNRTLRGYVIGLTEKPAIEEHRIKELLDIQTDEFDECVMTFELKDNLYDQSNRIYDEIGLSPTVTCTGADLMILVRRRS